MEEIYKSIVIMLKLAGIAIYEFVVFAGIWWAILLSLLPFVYIYSVIKKNPGKIIDIKYLKILNLIIVIIPSFLYIVLIPKIYYFVFEIIKWIDEDGIYKFMLLPVFTIIFFYFLINNKKQKRPVMLAELGILIIIFSVFTNVSLFQFKEFYETTSTCESYEIKAREEYLICKQNCIALEKALTQYKEKNSKYPQLITELKPKYIKEIPKCPFVGDDYSYTTSQTRDRFTLYCPSEIHICLGFPKNFPRISK